MPIRDGAAKGCFSSPKTVFVSCWSVTAPQWGNIHLKRSGGVWRCTMYTPNEEGTRVFQFPEGESFRRLCESKVLFHFSRMAFFKITSVQIFFTLTCFPAPFFSNNNLSRIFFLVNQIGPLLLSNGTMRLEKEAEDTNILLTLPNIGLF